MTRDDPIRVRYVLGLQRSGTTLIARVLANEFGAAYVGEVRLLWQRGDQYQACGCGQHRGECPVWSRVFGSFDEDQAFVAEMRQLERELYDDVVSHRRARHLARIAAGERSPAAEAFGSRLRWLYGRLVEAHDGAELVDGSKTPLIPAVLAGSDVTMRLHWVVRDPRGTVASALRRRPAGGAGRLQREATLLRLTGWWTLRQRECARVAATSGMPAELISYEAFVQGHAERTTTGPVPLARGHIPAAAGPMVVSEVPVEQDLRWRAELAWPEHVLVHGLTWPTRRLTVQPPRR